MKYFLFTGKYPAILTILFCAAFLASAGEKVIWNPKTIGLTSGAAEQTVSGDTLNVKCPVTWQKYDYLIITLQVRPFTFGNRALAFTVQNKKYLDEDSLYIKALDAEGTVVGSFYSMNPLEDPTLLVCAPKQNCGGTQYFAGDVKNPAGTVAKLQFYIGRRAPGVPIDFALSGLELVPAPVPPTTEGFQNFGIGIASAELRFCTAALDSRNRPVALAVPLDIGKTSLLLTELDTGKTRQFYPEPAIAGAAYGGVLTKEGKLVYSVGKQVIIFDINTRKFTLPGPTIDANLCGAIAPDGMVYLSGAPESRLTQIDPAKGTVKDCGRLDDKEEYTQTLAADREGIIYAGLGSARANIVAYSPSTGVRTQLLPENLRKWGYGKVVQGKDGFVYISFGDFRAKCLGGKIVAQNESCPDADNARQLYYGARCYEAGDGSRIVNYDFPNRTIRYRNSKGQVLDIPFDYVSGGLDLTCLAAGPDGKVYFSSAHPHHLGCVDPESGKITDLGYNPIVGGGNFCNMISCKDKLYACEYAGGRMWEYDPSAPMMFKMAKAANFGVPFGTLLAGASSRNGRWSELAESGLLLGIGNEEENALSFKLDVPRAGKWYLNGQFYTSEAYGTVTVRAGGKKFVCNTQTAPAVPGKIWTLGPFDLPEGTFPVEFSIAVNKDNPASQRFFSLIGLELAASPREKAEQTAPLPKLNPRILGRWADLATRPRTIAVHPDNNTVVMAGYANYGLVGGGFGVHDLAADKNRSVENFLEGESCIAMGFFPDGTLYGSTCTEAPGGGHTTATHASIFHYDLAGNKLLHKVDIPCRTVIAVIAWQGMIYAAGNNGRLYRIDPTTWTIAAHSLIDGGAVPRNGFLVTPDGKRLFMLQQKLISEILPSGESVPRAAPPYPIYAGGAIMNGKIFFAHSAARLGCWDYRKK